MREPAKAGLTARSQRHDLSLKSEPSPKPEARDEVPDEKLRAIFDALDVQHPGADTELHFTNAYELLAATILSAQSTDQRVNMVTPALFKRYPTPASLATATPGATRAADPLDRVLPRQVAGRSSAWRRRSSRSTTARCPRTWTR